MRTRNAAAAQKNPVPPPKKTPTPKKSAAATPPSTVELLTPNSDAPKSSSTPDTTPSVEQDKVSTDDTAVVPPTKGEAAPKKKVVRTRKVIRKVLRPKVPASAKAESAESATAANIPEVEDGKDDIMTDAKDDDQTPLSTTAAAADVGETEDGTDDKGQKDDTMTDVKDDALSIKDEEVHPKATESREQVVLGTQTSGELGDSLEKGKCKENDDMSTANAMVTSKEESPVTEVVAKSVEDWNESIKGQEEVECDKPNEEVGAGTQKLESEKLPQDQVDSMDHEQKRESTEDNQESKTVDDGLIDKAGEASQLKDAPVSEVGEACGDEERFVEPEDADLQEDDDEPDSIDDTTALSDENKELAAAANNRKVNKEHEIFVSGLDSEVVEDDVKKAFENVGEVVEVRLLKDPSTNKNRGLAFVRFGTKDQAKKAVSEMKNPIICGKQCGTALNEDNDTLFVGNICNTWTKEAINQKLKDFNIEGVEIITLVEDPRHEGLSRGFCFVQFACHTDAMSAYKRLQKSDAVFGHAERTVKVAFAEPLQEPDPEVMAKVKSVFIDGILPYWDEDFVKKHFKEYGEIERITLARNMSSAKRKDFGFVDYSTREAAFACIEEVNKKDLVDGNVKIKLRARLSNPLPKMQAVKGGMRGGIRIGRPAGRSLGHPGPSISRPNFQHGRMSHAPFHERTGPYGRRGSHRGGRGAHLANAGRPNIGGPRHIPQRRGPFPPIERGPTRPIPQHQEPFPLIEHDPTRPIPQHREPFPLHDGGYWRPFVGRNYDDPYMYSDRTESHGLKRPFYMTEPNPTYMEPGPVRARYDYTGAGRGTQLRDTYGAGSSMYSSGYDGTNYGAQPHSSFNARGRSYDNGRGGGPGRGRGSGYY